MTDKEIIKVLKDRIEYIKDNNNSLDAILWSTHEGVLISGNMAVQIVEAIEGRGMSFRFTEDEFKKVIVEARSTAPMLTSIDKMDYEQEAEQYFQKTFIK